MSLSNEEIRTELRKYARLFIEQNCHYSYNERICCQEVLHRIGPVNPVHEAFNREHPDHGKKITK